MRKFTIWLLLLTSAAAGKKFYHDDPLEKEPPPLRVEKAKPRKISDIYDLFSHIFATPGETHAPGKSIPAIGVNTLGEVPDNSWYQSRHGKNRMTIEELVRGPGNQNAPSNEGMWTVLSAKTEGITPGFMIQDSRGVRYLIKFDPVSNPEIATAADVIVSKFFHALGYNVPENYIVEVHREQLQIRPKATIVDQRGLRRPMTGKDVDEILMRVPRGRDGKIRAAASLLIKGDILREFRYFGTRSDDPNDIVPHEHRRELRGLQVFCAWLGHDDSRAINTLDTLVEENGLKYVKHYLIDFGSTLGSASKGPNSPRSGYEQFFTWKSSAKAFFSLGLDVPHWARIKYPDLPSVGRFSSQYFEPASWTPEYPNPAFRNRLPDDVFWAARQVMAFTDEEIRAIVKTGQYSDERAERYVGDVLIARRNAIGRAYLSRPGLLDHIRVEDGHIRFEDLGLRYGFTKSPAYTYEWFRFDNDSGTQDTIAGAAGTSIPAADGQYLGVRIAAGAGSPTTTVYLRRQPDNLKVVGIERAWN